MSFIRAKEIPPRSGNWYDYEVRCINEDGRFHQKPYQRERGIVPNELREVANTRRLSKRSEGN